MGSIPVAHPTPPRRLRLSRRAVLLTLAFLVSIAAILVVLAFAWPERPPEPSYEWVGLSQLEALPVNEPVAFGEHRLYLVRIASGEVLALSRKDPRGCTIPWRPDFVFQDKKGWFRDPCYGSTYTFAGDIVFGPSSRSMDRYPVAITDGEVVVDVRNRLCAPGYEYVPMGGYAGPEPPLNIECLSVDQYHGTPPQ